MNIYKNLQQQLRTAPRTWLITGAAGFIGSNLLETLLKLDQRVLGLDNISTGYHHNLDEVRVLVSPQQWANFQFIESDIRNLDDCRRAMTFVPSLRTGAAEPATHSTYPVDYVLHQAALGSVPRSIADPIITNQNNIDGFLNMLVAARDAKVLSFVYAASSSTYGDHPSLPKVEERIGKPLSPYAVTKYVNELYAEVFARTYDFNTIGLRYFNIFGRRQDPAGAYAAVIPKWTAALLNNETVYINGDGETSRDFCYIDNAVQANLLAASVTTAEATNQVYNVAVGDRTTLNELFDQIAIHLQSHVALSGTDRQYCDFRAGDVRHSLADISKARRLLGYAPTHRIGDGLAETMDWYIRHQ